MKKITLITAMLLVAGIAGAQGICHAKTLKGQQCTRKAIENGYCKQHNPSAKHCTGITKTGQQCHNLPSKGSTFCHIHKG